MHDPPKKVDAQEKFREAVHNWARGKDRQLHIEFTVACLNDPKPGDSYHEMFSHWVYVTSVKDGVVEFDHGFGENFSRDELPIAGFAAKYLYGSIYGSWVDIAKREGKEVTIDMVEDWWRDAASRSYK